MYVLHAGEHSDSLVFWAESSEGAEARRGGRGSKSSRDTGSPESYRFAAGPGQLRRILRSVGITTTPRDTHRVRVHLPARGSVPIPSGDLITEWGGGHAAAAPPASPERPKLKQYGIDVVSLSAEDGTTLLCRVMGKRTIEPGVIVGADLAYMTDIMRLAGSMVARQQYLPDVEALGNGRMEASHHAVWRPVPTASDSERFDALSGSMPGAVRAFSRGDAPAESPADVLFRILTRMISHLVRASALMNAAAPPRGGHRRRKRFDSLHDAWMHQLRAARPGPLDGPDIPQFVGQVREWQQSITALADSPLHLCFRLEEPEGDGADGQWRVRYLLQSRDDPSLLVPADEAWDGKPHLPPDGRSSVREFLLVSLGQASGIFGGIAAGMSERGAKSGMGGCTLTADGAYSFLTGEAAALRQAGYVVMLPSWWTGRGTRARIKARADVRAPKVQGGVGVLSLSTIVQFDWTIAVNDKSLTADELQRLADAKSPLVKVRGEWMEVTAGDIRRAAEFLKKKGGKAPLMDIMKMKLGVYDGRGSPASQAGAGAAGALDISVDSKDSSILQVLRRLNERADLEEAAQPDDFSGRLRPYQLRGLSWMAFLQKWSLGGCLADDMGLGKTVQVLALVQRYRQGGGRKPFLLVCPTSVMSNWQREASRFTPGIQVMMHHGVGRVSGAAFKREIRRYGMVVSSYGLLQRDIPFLKKAGWGGVILDEAQNIKNPHTKQAQAAREVEAECRFALTGTPVENSVYDLWSIMEFLNPSFLGTQTQFKDRFFRPIQSMQDEEAARMLRRATGPFILRRLKTDKSIISDLPEKIETKAYCTLTREQASLYGAVLGDIEEAIAAAEGIQRKGIILSALARLKQVCDHPAIFLKDNSGATAGPGRARSGKLARLVEMLSEVTDAGDSALVFTQFVEMGHMLRRHLQETFGREVLFLHGGVPRGQRDKMISRFQEGAGPQLFVISLKAGGTGLNLTAASHVFHFDRWWNPAVEDQATDRAFRIGQKHNVQVHKMICAGTLEEKIDDMIERKKDVSRKVIGSGEAWLTEMSNEDLRDILALSSKATSGGDHAEEAGWEGGR